MSFYGIELDVQKKEIIHDIKMKFSNRSSGVDVRKLTRCFKYFDGLNTGNISSSEFIRALKEVAIIYRPNETQVLASFFKSTCGTPNYINYMNFLKEFKQPMSERRRKHVDACFEVMDHDKTGS